MFGQNKAIFYRYEEFRQNGLKMGLIVKHRLVADRHRQTDTDTDTGPWLVPRMHSIAR